MALRLFYLVFIYNFFETLAFCKTKDIFGRVTKVYILLKWSHEHYDEVFLGKHILLEQLDILIVLQQNIQSYKVNLF